MALQTAASNVHDWNGTAAYYYLNTTHYTQPTILLKKYYIFNITVVILY